MQAGNAPRKLLLQTGGMLTDSLDTQQEGHIKETLHPQVLPGPRPHLGKVCMPASPELPLFSESHPHFAQKGYAPGLGAGASPSDYVKR